MKNLRHCDDSVRGAPSPRFAIYTASGDVSEIRRTTLSVALLRVVSARRTAYLPPIGQAGQRLRATLDGFLGRAAVMQIQDANSDTWLDERVESGIRSWAGTMPATRSIRIRVVRLAPYCDRPMGQEL